MALTEAHRRTPVANTQARERLSILLRGRSKGLIPYNSALATLAVGACYAKRGWLG